jgi:hypothetical protein
VPYNTAIFGVGSVSARFTAKFIDALAVGRRSRDLVASGIYSEGQDEDELHTSFAQRVRHMRMKDISVGLGAPGQSLQTDLTKVRRQIEKVEPNSLLLIIDSHLVAQAAATFHELRSFLPRMKIDVLCFTDGGGTAGV